VSPGTYRVVEVQAVGLPRRHRHAGTNLSGVALSNDIFSNVVFPAAGNASGINYNFGNSRSPRRPPAR